MNGGLNIWSLEKDINIKNLLLRLKTHLVWKDLRVICRDEEDNSSIRLTSANPSATELYIYCYGQSEDHYGVHIEFPDINENNYGDTLEIHENMTFEQLLNLIEINLGNI